MSFTQVGVKASLPFCSISSPAFLNAHIWSPSLSPPIDHSLTAQSSLVSLFVGGEPSTLLTTQVSCPLSSPGCQAASDVRVPQTLPSLAPF